jgi:YD repeat-containing protein
MSNTRTWRRGALLAVVGMIVGSAPRDARADAKVLNLHGDLSISVNMNDASDRWATFHQARALQEQAFWDYQAAHQIDTVYEKPSWLRYSQDQAWDAQSMAPSDPATVTCPNRYGASYTLSVGADQVLYSGSQLLSATEQRVLTAAGREEVVAANVSVGPHDLAAGTGMGWSFPSGGMLIKTYERTATKVLPPPTSGGLAELSCFGVVRFHYVTQNDVVHFQKRGIEQRCLKKLKVNSEALESEGGRLCPSGRMDERGQSDTGESPEFCPTVTQYWSTDGQVALDVENPEAPEIRLPNGSVIRLERAHGTDPTVPFVAQHEELFATQLGDLGSVGHIARWVAVRTTDANGNFTSHEYDPETGWLSATKTPSGVVTRYERDASGLVRSIRYPGIGGKLRSWEFTWTPFDLDPRAAVPELDCFYGGGSTRNAVACRRLQFRTLTKVTHPDGRAIAFEYGTFGNLTKVITPDGAVTRYEYGRSGFDTSELKPTFSFPPPGLTTNGYGQPSCPYATPFLYQKRLVATAVYPNGEGRSPVNVTTIEHETLQDVAKGTERPGFCARLQWIKTTHPDGHVSRTATCDTGETFHPLASMFAGRTFATEIRDASGIREATYHGDPLTGELFLAWDTASRAADYPVSTPRWPAISPWLAGGALLDLRPTKVVSMKDGVRWTLELEYDRPDADPSFPAAKRIPSDGGVRTLGNVVKTTLRDARGQTLRVESTKYMVAERYLEKNLLRLATETVMSRPMNGGVSTEILGVTEKRYDEPGLRAVDAPNLDTTVGDVRGNETSMTTYANAAARSGAITVRTAYYATGETASVTNGRGATTETLKADFAECSPSHLVRFTTQRNAKGHEVTKITDCFTGQELAVIDENRNRTCMQYDEWGRKVETAMPGDPLSPLDEARFTRVKECDPPPNMGVEAVVGGGGKGPTSWTDFAHAFDAVGQKRVVVRMKNGAKEGLRKTTWSDGMGRPIMTCERIDRRADEAYGDVCTIMEYDPMGRLWKESSRHNSEAATAPLTMPPGVRYTETSYDALGRKVTAVPMRDGAPVLGLAKSVTSWGPFDEVSWKVVVRTYASTDAPENEKTVALAERFSIRDVQGRTLEEAERYEGCEGGVCRTRMTHDGVGNVLTITAPSGRGGGGYVTRMTYDSLGRKLSVEDPNTGRSTYGYDERNNVVWQVDARGARVDVEYDVLDRPLVKRLSPVGNVPGQEIRYAYDGEAPR